MSNLVLIAEDEVEIADILGAYLRQEGFRTVWAADGETAAELHAALKPDLVLLDVRMPGRDGWDVLGELRRRGETPIIMITALDKDIDKLQALRIGADDYVVKPFNPVEVVARVHAILRRGSTGGGARILRVGPLEIDTDGYLAHFVGASGRRRLSLTLTEFRMLAHLATAPMRVFTRAELAEVCLARADVQDRTVDSHLSKVRRKLEEVGAEGVLVSVRGVGYRLEPNG
ncbi:response regulator [Brevundimonas faecalis]|uniref:Two-component system response regulator AdeR n=1 Tax=Brevundimonas faecalis TaxID=947378 RepID=A0ABV2R6D0_9CAUL